MISCSQLLSSGEMSQFALVVDYDFKSDSIETNSPSMQEHSFCSTNVQCKFIGLQTVRRLSQDQMFSIELQGIFHCSQLHIVRH